MLTKEQLLEQLSGLQQKRDMCANQFHELSGACQAIEMLLRLVEQPAAPPAPVKPQLVQPTSKPDMKPDIVSG